MNKEKIVVIGTDKESENFLYQSNGKYEVVFFIDKNPRRNTFRGISVITFDSIFAMLQDMKYKIVIATDEEEYLAISLTLMQYGLQEFRDFYYYQALDKKLAFFWGNCHVQDLAVYLKGFPEFSREYWIYPQTGVHEYDCRYLSKSFFEHCKLFVFQEIKEVTNGILCSSAHISSLMSEDSIKIKVPNLFRKGFAFFPQAYYKKVPLMRDCEHKFVVNSDNHDKYILEKTKSGATAEEIAFSIEHDAVFEAKDILDGLQMLFATLKEIDENCDVKIGEWIERNYQDKLIFIDPGHLSKRVFVEYIDQIMRLIHVNDVSKDDIIEKLNPETSTLYMPVYGCVRDALDLKWVDIANQNIKQGTWKCSDENMDLPEYTKQYIYICAAPQQI